MLQGLSQINIELTSRCDKSCDFCGHQNLAINTNLKFGDIKASLLKDLSFQLPSNIVVQFHRDGEALLFPELRWALSLFDKQVTSIVTNGKKLVDKAEDIIGYCDTLTLSIFLNDPEGDEQFTVFKRFIEIKGDDRPMVNVKIVGDIETGRYVAYEDLGVKFIHRLLHVAPGSFGYKKGRPMIPETGICQDFMSHPSIDWTGKVYVCNRLDVKGNSCLGDLNHETLDSIWNGEKRMKWMDAHVRGRRDQAAPICKKCEFYGVPSG